MQVHSWFTQLAVVITVLSWANRAHEVLLLQLWSRAPQTPDSAELGLHFGLHHSSNQIVNMKETQSGPPREQNKYTKKVVKFPCF